MQSLYELESPRSAQILILPEIIQPHPKNQRRVRRNKLRPPLAIAQVRRQIELEDTLSRHILQSLVQPRDQRLCGERTALSIAMAERIVKHRAVGKAPFVVDVNGVNVGVRVRQQI